MTVDASSSSPAGTSRECDRVTIQISMKRLVGVRSQAVIAATIAATRLNKFITLS